MAHRERYTTIVNTLQTRTFRCVASSTIYYYYHRPIAYMYGTSMLNAYIIGTYQMQMQMLHIIIQQSHLDVAHNIKLEMAPRQAIFEHGVCTVQNKSINPRHATVRNKVHHRSIYTHRAYMCSVRSCLCCHLIANLKSSRVTDRSVCATRPRISFTECIDEVIQYRLGHIKSQDRCHRRNRCAILHARCCCWPRPAFAARRPARCCCFSTILSQIII